MFTKNNLTNKSYHILTHKNYTTDCILFIGKNQQGGDILITNFAKIINNLLQTINTPINTSSNTSTTSLTNTSTTPKEVFIENNHNILWLHGHNKSPHFILYRKSKEIIIDPLELELFIKTKLPEKSEKNKPLSCCYLFEVVKTEVLGMVTVPHRKLSNLLK